MRRIFSTRNIGLFFFYHILVNDNELQMAIQEFIGCTYGRHVQTGEKEKQKTLFVVVCV